MIDERGIAWMVEVVALRRFLGSVSVLRRTVKTARPLEAFWVLLEATTADQQQRPTTQKQLCALATGVFSPPTICRAVKDLVAAGLLDRGANAADSRSPLLLTNAKTLAVLGERCLVTVALLRQLLTAPLPSAAPAKPAEDASEGCTLPKPLALASQRGGRGR
jgi:hypothetical protein